MGTLLATPTIWQHLHFFLPSFLWENFLRRWQYSGVQELVPKNLRIYEGTPVSSAHFIFPLLLLIEIDILGRER